MNIPADLLPRLTTEVLTGPAVYFLLVADECVYVGGSIHPGKAGGDPPLPELPEV
jgi:hypothetical protein